jgi:hypothetical protein
MMKTKALYSISELSKMIGMSLDQTERILSHLGVEIKMIGRKRWVFLSDLKSQFPELWESLKEKQLE